MDSKHVVSFMVNFAQLKSWVDDPDQLVSDAIRDESVRDLCDKLSWDAFWLKHAEKTKPELFTAPVNPDFIAAWRDYEKWYEPAVSWISANVFFAEAGFSDGSVEDGLASTRPPRPKPMDIWRDADSEAAKTVAAIQSVIDFAQSHIDVEDVWDDHPNIIEDVESGILAWKGLAERSGVDLRGTLRRRALVPFVLVPRKISNQQGSKERTALMLNMQEAQQAFVNGTLSAAVALLRATVEVVLKEHYKAFGDSLEARINSMRNRLPPRVTVRELDELRKMANLLLHSERCDSADRLEKDVPEAELKVVEFLVVVRAVIEAVK